MQTTNNDFLGCLKREFLRMALENIQGRQLQKAIDKAQKVENIDSKYEVEEILNNPYMNRSEVPLAMDIFKPIVPDGQELPVIVYIHGGGLVLGDRKMSRVFGRVLAGYGYLVFSIEYRLAPRANSAQQLDDVCAGMDLIGRKLVDFDVDFGRVFLAAESAGAYLAIYVAAMKESKKLQDAIGYEPTRMRFAALGLVSGMFYTNRPDPIGFFLSEQFYGDKITDKKFLKYMDPENSEIVDNLPPAFFVTSRGDFLNNYTLMYHKKLKKAGKKTKLIYYGDEELGHAFVMLQPLSKKSKDALDKMLDWFEQKAKERIDELKETENAKKQKITEKTKKEESKTGERKEANKAATKSRIPRKRTTSTVNRSKNKKEA
ncbi:alpha/beta hydrolase [Butyrivibrio sp. WCE2006]|uniref:alpha/beta hydrolase n=1 Tax=Butyrivibrio sp. WCE2006 TaxID=1410611 RepID=UPI0006798E03|nr:alpha/beta hydrolase [Butyrivibrio sp. WCE2006]